MSRQSHPCPAQQMVLPLAIGTAVVASGIMNAHMQGLAAIREAREAKASHLLRGQLDVAIGRAQQIADFATELAQENAKLRAEAARYKRLAQQHYDTVLMLTEGNA